MKQKSQIQEEKNSSKSSVMKKMLKSLQKNNELNQIQIIRLYTNRRILNRIEESDSDIIENINLMKKIEMN